MLSVCRMDRQTDRVMDGLKDVRGHVAQALGAQAGGEGRPPPSGAQGGERSPHPCRTPRAGPVTDHQAPHFPSRLSACWEVGHGLDSFPDG